MSDARGKAVTELDRELPRFQRATEAVDAAAGAVLGLSAQDLRCVDVLRFGTASESSIAAALGLSAREARQCVDRLHAAGYVRRSAPAAREGELVDLTEHARAWIETLWGPIRDEGRRLLDSLTTRELQILARFLREGSELQERHAAHLREMAEVPGSVRPRAARAHGGLSPAALRRVQLFALAHLERPLRLDALAARAGVSRFHFARAFKASTGETPYGFVQRLRVEKAQQLLRETDLPLGEVAIACGYSSQSKLTHAVRRASGFTPARYRRLHR